MTSLSLIKTSALSALVALGLSACVVAPRPHHQGAYPQGPGAYPQVGQPPVMAHDGVVYAHVAPPAPYVEVIPVLPFLGAVWLNGYWNWSGNRHVWVPGHHARPVHGHRYQPHRWAPAPRGGYQLHRGGWVR